MNSNFIFRNSNSPPKQRTSQVGQPRAPQRRQSLGQRGHGGHGWHVDAPGAREAHALKVEVEVQVAGAGEQRRLGGGVVASIRGGAYLKERIYEGIRCTMCREKPAEQEIVHRTSRKSIAEKVVTNH